MDVIVLFFDLFAESFDLKKCPLIKILNKQIQNDIYHSIKK